MLQRHIDRKTGSERLIKVVDPLVEPLVVVGRLRNDDQAVRVGVGFDREDVGHSRCRRTVAATLATLRRNATAGECAVAGLGATSSTARTRSTAKQRAQEVANLGWISKLEVIGAEDAARGVRWKIPRVGNKAADLNKNRRGCAHGERVHRLQHGDDEAVASTATLPAARLSRLLRSAAVSAIWLRARAAHRLSTRRTIVGKEVLDDRRDSSRVLILEAESLGRVVIPGGDVEHVDQGLDLLGQADVARKNDLVRVAVGSELRVILGNQRLDALKHIGRP